MGSSGSDAGSGTSLVDATVSTSDASLGEASTDTSTSSSPDATTGAVSILTNRYDNSRNGANTSETTLTVANVGGGKFGLLFTRPLDGHIQANPLYMPGLSIGGATHNVVFVATEHDTVYAFDADSATATTPLWTVSLGTPMNDIPGAGTGQPLVGNETVTCRDMYPHTGITSTPAIDAATGRMYVVAKSIDAMGGYHQNLHALDVLTGMDVAGSPVEIEGSVSGTGVGSDGGVLAFSPYHHLNRPGLLLTGGNVFIGFASHCDDPPYHGWVFAYDATTLTQTGIFATTPTGMQGGIWQSGMGLVGDTDDVYFVSGNGTIDPTNAGANVGLSVGHLQLSATGLKLTDWWSAYNATTLNASDSDFTSAPVLLPNPKVLVAGGKDSNLYVLDPNNMGRYNGSKNNILQTVPLSSGHIHGGPVYWNGPAGPTIFVWPESGAMRSFSIDPTTMLINTTPLSQYSGASPTHPGGMITLSSNGSTAGTAIVWATFTSAAVDTVSGQMGDAWHYMVPGVFYAFDATNLTTPIWMSTTNSARDSIGLFAKYNPPVVANGKVYLGSAGPISELAGVNAATPTPGSDAGQLLVYGLLP